MTARSAARRIGFALVTALLVVTATFAVTVVYPQPPNVFGPDDPPPESHPRDADTPLTERYVTWLVKFVTLDWGYGGQSVTAATLGAVGVTATYLVPALLVSYGGGVAIGVRAALNRGSVFDYGSRLFSYLAFAVPTFFVATMVVFFLGWEQGWRPRYDPERAHLSTYNLLRLVAPAVAVVATTTAIQLRHARSEVLQELRAGYTKLARSQGASDRRLGRYALRNAAVAILSLFVAELLGIVLLSAIALELLLDVPGFGSLLVSAARGATASQVMGVTFVLLAVGLGGALLRDTVATALDPRR